ncbi:MAG: hypothetical protein RIS24_2840 [Verrucomicrobiota bacterium]
MRTRASTRPANSTPKSLVVPGPSATALPFRPRCLGTSAKNGPPRSGVLSLEQAHSMPNRQRVAHLAEKWGQVQTLSLKAAA